MRKATHPLTNPSLIRNSREKSAAVPALEAMRKLKVDTLPINQLARNTGPAQMRLDQAGYRWTRESHA